MLHGHLSISNANASSYSEHTATQQSMPVADQEKEAVGEQPESEIAFDGMMRYAYTGYVLEENGQYRRVTVSFTCEEIGVYATEDLERVRAMVDRVGRDAGRQAEIRRYGKRAWHTPYRPEKAYEQALDWALGHDVPLAARIAPYVAQLFQEDPSKADQWTRELRVAFLERGGDPARFKRLLARAGVPERCLGSMS
jgi:hypothetical protein